MSKISTTTIESSSSSAKNKIIIYGEIHSDVKKKVYFFTLLYNIYGDKIKFFDEASCDSFFMYKGERILIRKLEPAIMTIPERILWNVENPQIEGYTGSLIIVQNFPSILSDIVWLVDSLTRGNIIDAEGHFNNLYYYLNENDGPEVRKMKNSLFNLFTVVYKFNNNPESITKKNDKFYLDEKEIMELDNFAKTDLPKNKIPDYFTNYFIIEEFLPFIRRYGSNFNENNIRIYDEFRTIYRRNTDEAISYLENLRDDIMVKTIQDYTTTDSKSILCMCVGERHVDNIKRKLERLGYRDIESTKSDEILSLIRKLRTIIQASTTIPPGGGLEPLRSQTTSVYASASASASAIVSEEIFNVDDIIEIHGLEKEKFQYLNGKRGKIIQLNAQTDPLRHKVLVEGKKTTIGIQPKNLRKI